MPAKIVVVCNQKGGAGKTTVSMQLAGILAKRELKVLVIDADPQGTATRWAASASDEQPFPAPVVGLSPAGGKIHREIGKFVDDYDVIVVDCPPAADSHVPQSALLVADLAIVPLVPSPLDLWASVGIREVIARMSDVNEPLQARLLLNQAQPNQTLTKETVQILADFDIPQMHTSLRQRAVYRQCAVWGQTVLELDNAPAKAEVEALGDEVLGLLSLNQTEAKSKKKKTLSKTK
jgi:chromosome partitioning protein